MANEFNGLLTATVFLPAIAALLLAVGILRGDRAIRWFAVLVTAADLALSVVVFALFQRGGERFQLIDRFTWIDTSTVQANYLLGVDGISAPLVMLTGLLGLCAVFASFHVGNRVKELLHLAAGAADGRYGRVHLAGFPVVLPFLGTRTGADVPPDLNLGHGTARIFGDEIPDIHDTGLGVHAGCHRRRVRQRRSGQLRHDPPAGTRFRA